MPKVFLDLLLFLVVVISYAQIFLILVVSIQKVYLVLPSIVELVLFGLLYFLDLLEVLEILLEDIFHLLDFILVHLFSITTPHTKLTHVSCLRLSPSREVFLLILEEDRHILGRS